MIKRFIPAVLATLMLTTPALAAPKAAPKAPPKPAAPTPAPAADSTLGVDQTPLGRGYFSLGAQMTSTHGLLAAFHTGFNLGGAELGASLMAPPGNLLSFFTAEGHLMFIGQTGSFLPINLMPLMGFGAASYFRDVPNAAGTGTTLDLGMWLYMPLGLRYVIPLGPASLSAEAVYHLPAVYMIKGVTDPARWHVEVTARTGQLMGGVYYEAGAVYNGPGARVGLVF